MTPYQVTAIITLNSIDITLDIEADSPEQAEKIMQSRIDAGEFNEEIDARAQGRGFEVDSIEVGA